MFILLEERDNPDRAFVMHTTTPRFLMEFIPGGEGDFIPIDRAYTADELAMHKSRAREFFEQGEASPVESRKFLDLRESNPVPDAGDGEECSAM